MNGWPPQPQVGIAVSGEARSPRTSIDDRVFAVVDSCAGDLTVPGGGGWRGMEAEGPSKFLAPVADTWALHAHAFGQIDVAVPLVSHLADNP